MIDLHVHTHVTTTIRELGVGQSYITLTNMHRGRVTAEQVRQKTEDPFVSLTLMGAKVSSFPSDRCHPVEVIDNTLHGAIATDG